MTSLTRVRIRSCDGGSWEDCSSCNWSAGSTERTSKKRLVQAHLLSWCMTVFRVIQTRGDRLCDIICDLFGYVKYTQPGMAVPRRPKFAPTGVSVLPNRARVRAFGYHRNITFCFE